MYFGLVVQHSSSTHAHPRLGKGNQGAGYTKHGSEDSKNMKLNHPPLGKTHDVLYFSYMHTIEIEIDIQKSYRLLVNFV